MGGGLAGHESTRAYFLIPLPCLLGMTGQPKLPLTVASNWLLVLLGAGRAICKPPSQKKKKGGPCGAVAVPLSAAAGVKVPRGVPPVDDASEKTPHRSRFDGGMKSDRRREDANLPKPPNDRK